MGGVGQHSDLTWGRAGGEHAQALCFEPLWPAPHSLNPPLPPPTPSLPRRRSHLALEDGGRPDAAPRPGYGAYPSAATPMAAGGRTPMHPGITATPMHYSQHATPMHPGMTPSREALTKTPAYDPAWAATPAHPGFGGEGAACLECCPAGKVLG